MHFELKEINPKTLDCDLVLLYGNDVAPRQLPLNTKEQEYLKTLRSTDHSTVAVFDRLPYHLYVVSFDDDKPTQESQEWLRRSAVKVVEMMRNCHGNAEVQKNAVREQTNLAVTGKGIIPEELVSFLEGLSLADYSYDRYKSKQPRHIDTVFVDSNYLATDELDGLVRLWERIVWCRDWVNTPVCDLNAEKFASQLEDIARSIGVECTVMDKARIEKEGMGGLLAVNRGSVDEPRFVVLRYHHKNAKNRQPIALVGKGVMYDSGGLNIKPDEHMREMKSDMAGAATMASVVFAAAENHLPVDVVAVLPMTDNRPGFNAYAADDILTMYDGTTVEVINTDAEGRLILADAIAYAVRNFDPCLIVDAATLTGAAVRAIGTYGIAAMQQNAENPMRLMKIVGEQVYERIAELPFWKEYDEHVESDVADMKNCGPSEAGAITAGKFLAHFAKETPYIHLDIAGVAFFSKKQWYYAQGASGFGIRLLYAYLQVSE